MTNVFSQIRLSPHSIQKIFEIIVLGSIAIVYYLWTWSSVLAHFGGDNAMYLIMAKLYSPFTENTLVLKSMAANSQFPPLYPFLLGWTGGGESILVAHLVSTTFLLVAIYVFYQWILLNKLNYINALLTVILIAIMPGTYIQALSVHSESLYLLLSLSGLYSVTYYENSGQNKWLIFGAILIACASLSRSAGLSLIISFIIYLIIQRDKKIILLSLVSFLPMTIWSLFNDQNGTSYVSALSGYYSADFFNLLLQQIANQYINIKEAWFVSFTYGIFGHIFLSIFSGLCFMSVISRIYLKNVDGVYALIYILMILVWPYPAESLRMLFPIIPVLLFQSSMLLKNIMVLSNKDNLQAGNLIIEGVLLIIVLPNLLLTVTRFNFDIDYNLIPYKRTYAWYIPFVDLANEQARLSHLIMSSLVEAKEVVPVDQCVYSIKPSVVSLYMERVSLAVPAQDISDEEFKRILIQSECRYFYLMSIRSPSYNTPLYPIERLVNDIDILKIYYLDEQQKVNPVAILGRLKNI